MQGDDPPFLPVGTDVSAKYKGAFCEAKIKKVVRNIKCKVTLKAGGGTIIVNDDVIKGNLRVGNTVEVKQDPKKDAVEAVIAKIQDCSQYTVVFDDGDITTLRRSALCLKSGRHFNESETLDQLPLTHPEHFSTPVIAGRRGRRGRAQSEESEGEATPRRVKADSEPHVGRVVLVEAAGGAERRRPHQPAFPALVVAPTAQIKVKEDYLVRSFKDGRYYTVPKKEAREFRKGSAPLEWCGVEAALQYLNNNVLPPHWDRDTLFNEPRNTSDDSSDDEPREEKDHFVAQLYKFMDDRGTPLNRNPTIANRDIDLYRLFRVTQKLGGYNRVTNQNQWKTIADKMGFHPVTTSITNLCKQAYKKFLHSFEDFYRKLGVTLVAHPRGARTPPAGRSLIRDRDKLLPASSSASSTPTGTPTQRKDKDSDKSETEKSDKSEKDDKAEKPKEKQKTRGSDGEDSADNQPLATAAPKVEKEKEKDKDIKNTASTSTSDEKVLVKPRSQSKTRVLPPAKVAERDQRTPKRRPLSAKPGESVSASVLRASRRPHVSTDSDSSGRASRCGITKKMQSRRSQSVNSASSGNTIASNSSKRPRKRKNTEPSTSEPTRIGGTNVKAQVGDKLKVYYGPNQSESKVTYEAKVIEISAEGMLRVHYTGWNTRYDEWIKPQRIAVNVTQYEARNKKNTSLNRRVRAKRTEESSARSDSDSDSDSEMEVKRLTKKSEDKSSSTKTPLRSKDAKSSDSSSSSKSRKRPVRNVTTPSIVSPAKKPRPASTSHQGRDYDLNEIRSELKGLHTVNKQESEDPVKQESPDKAKKTETFGPIQAAAPPPEPSQPEKQAEDVYEFKEPEPFELELHDEKKKRTHRIFDDISPSKYTSTLSKSLSEEISEDPLRPRPTSMRSPSLSPFREFSCSRDPPDSQSPEEDTKDDIFSIDDDSFQDGSSGPIFEGFTPAKNQETYSKKSKVSKLRELIDDSPDSPADDEESSEDESENISMKEEEKHPSPVPPPLETIKLPEQEVKEDTTLTKESKPMKDEKLIIEEELKEVAMEIDVSQIPEPPNSPPPESKIELTSITQSLTDTAKNENLVNIVPLEEIKLPSNDVPEKTVSMPELNETKPELKLSKPEIKPNKPELKVTKPELIATTPETKPIKPESTEIKEPPKKIEEEKPQISEDIKLLSIPLPSSEPKESTIKINVEKNLDIEPLKSNLEPPSSPLIDTEEDKSEPDSPARIDVLLPEPPPGFLLQSKGPKIAENLLKAINSAKRLSMSPPPIEDRPVTPKKDVKSITTEDKLSTITPELKTPSPSTSKIEAPKPINKVEPAKKITPDASETLFKPLDVPEKKDIPEVKKIKSKEPTPTPPRLQSPLNILERRKSLVADLPLTTPGKNNKVLSDTIQKLSSQINQSAASIPLPPFPSEDRSESSDSDDSDRRLIIDKLSVEEWGSNTGETNRSIAATGAVVPRPAASLQTLAGPGAGLHAGKSAGEWSAGETLLMLEDACKNERKQSASVVVAGSGRVGPSAGVSGMAGGGGVEEEGNLSLLLCSETIPGSPAPDAEPAPPRQRLHMPFACAPQHHHHKAEERGGGAERGGGGEGRGEAAEGGAMWGRRHALLDNTPPTTPDSSLDMSPQPHRERRISERDSPSERKDEDDESRQNDASMDIDKPHGVRSRKASESSGASALRGRRRARRDTDDAAHQTAPLKYNFYVELDETWDCQTRINVLTSRLAELRKTYHSVKAELAAIDRRRKKLRRKEREAVKAAKAACS